jgi:UDP-glucose 4-epimerase
MRALVTGGAGFIGSHVTGQLVNEGHEVTVLDNLATGRVENLAHIRDRVRLVEADVSNFDLIRPHFDGVDWVFHLAALADIVPSIQRPLEYHRANVDGTVAVVEASRQAGVARFLYAASASCYGIAEQQPTPETAPAQPQYPYALSKYLGEQIALHWGRVYDLPVVSLRLFNVYGPRSRTTGAYGAVFGVFLAQKLAGKPYTVVGDGTQTRDFTFVTDVARAFLRAAASDARQEVLNVGTGKPQSVNRLVELLGGQVVHVPKRPGEPDRTAADITRIRERLGWEPKVSFETGVATMLEHIDLWRDAPVWDEGSIAVATRDWFAHLGSSTDS